MTIHIETLHGIHLCLGMKEMSYEAKGVSQFGLQVFRPRENPQSQPH